MLSLTRERLQEAEKRPNASLVSQSPECRLLNLPPEVRMLIWEFCLAQRTICITSNAGWQPKSRRKPVVSWWLSAYDDDPLNDWKPTLSEGLALLRTCRLVYREGVKILYGSNTFAFDHEMVRYHHSIGYALERMIHHGAVLPERLADIRSVRKVSDWSNSITLGWIQLFPKLRKFVMIMDRRRPPGNAYSTVKQWLQPVLDHPTILVFELGYNPYAMDSSDYDSTLDWSAEFDKRIKECMEAHGWTISTEFLKWTGRRDFFCSRKNITQGQVLSIKSSDIQK
ncbi:MAG: hypothetical protein M1814_006647 [Vezdaea aestivalis]|nr:MAG: hypothetical protein M1814_006647 [Vezdaea aestivalis]